MPENRRGCLLAAAVFAGLLFYFDKSFFLWCIAALAVLTALLYVRLHQEAGGISVQVRIPSGIQAGRRVMLTLEVRSRRRWLGTGCLAAELEADYTMFKTTQRGTICLNMTGAGRTYEIPVSTDWCGEICIRCAGLYAMDPLRLFRVPVTPFAGVHSIIYPKTTQLRLEQEPDRSGRTEQEGAVQNRKGQDPNEIYEVREYVPGDDIRSVHWKLSGKMDRLMLREKSSPAHFDLLLLPELEGRHQEEKEDVGTVNKAVSVVIAAGEELLSQGILFCMAVPGETEPELVAVRSREELLRALEKWLSTPISEQTGAMLRSILSRQQDRCFTRLLMIGEEEHLPDLGELDGRIPYTAVCVAGGLEKMQVQRNAHGILVRLPQEHQPAETYRILC